MRNVDPSRLTPEQRDAFYRAQDNRIQRDIEDERAIRAGLQPEDVYFDGQDGAK